MRGDAQLDVFPVPVEHQHALAAGARARGDGRRPLQRRARHRLRPLGALDREAEVAVERDGVAGHLGERRARRRVERGGRALTPAPPGRLLPPERGAASPGEKAVLVAASPPSRPPAVRRERVVLLARGGRALEGADPRVPARPQLDARGLRAARAIITRAEEREDDAAAGLGDDVELAAAAVAPTRPARDDPRVREGYRVADDQGVRASAHRDRGRGGVAREGVAGDAVARRGRDGRRADEEEELPRDDDRVARDPPRAAVSEAAEATHELPGDQNAPVEARERRQEGSRTEGAERGRVDVESPRGEALDDDARRAKIRGRLQPVPELHGRALGGVGGGGGGGGGVRVVVRLRVVVREALVVVREALANAPRLHRDGQRRAGALVAVVEVLRVRLELPEAVVVVVRGVAHDVREREAPRDAPANDLHHPVPARVHVQDARLIPELAHHAEVQRHAERRRLLARAEVDVAAARHRASRLLPSDRSRRKRGGRRAAARTR